MNSIFFETSIGKTPIALAQILSSKFETGAMLTLAAVVDNPANHQRLTDYLANPENKLSADAAIGFLATLTPPTRKHFNDLLRIPYVGHGRQTRPMFKGSIGPGIFTPISPDKLPGEILNDDVLTRSDNPRIILTPAGISTFPICTIEKPIFHATLTSYSWVTVGIKPPHLIFDAKLKYNATKSNWE